MDLFLRMRIRRAAVGAALLLSLPLAATAQPGNGDNSGNYIGVGLGWNWLHDNSVHRPPPPFTFRNSAGFDNGPAGMLSFGHLFPSGFRTELELAYRHNDFDSLYDIGNHYAARGSASSWALFYNALYDFQTGSAITPYIGLGIGAIRVSYNSAAPFGRTASRAGARIDDADSGLGYQAIAGVRFALNDHLALTADYRYYDSIHQPKFHAEDSDTLVSADYAGNTLMVGLEFGFGGAAQPAPPVEAPPPMPVQPRDSDNDGVTDDFDQCPNTPPGVQVDQNGCSLDRDNDGVPNAQDQCPNTRPGVQVNYQGCEVLQTRKLSNLHFAFDSAKLTSEDQRYLDTEARKINQALDKYPRATVEIAGYTDSIGTEKYNQGLSQRRTDSVLDYLTGHGIDQGRIESHGYGEADPVASNDTKTGRAQNRRVEVRLIGHNPAQSQPEYP